MPSPPTVRIGVWENNKFIGVIIFSRGASSNIGKPFKLNQNEIVELTRIALKSHQTPVTKFLSIAIKMLKKHSPGIKLIVSYADPNQGHLGKIYQASNWIYTGQTVKTTLYFDKTGKKFHSRQVSEKGFNKQYGERRTCPKPSQLRHVRQLGKHKYLYPLDNLVKSSILKYKKEYPKCELSLTAEQSSLQKKSEGSTPISSHQIIQ